MPTQSESTILLKQDQYRRIVQDYVNKVDSIDVFKARLFGIGYRGAEITTEVNLAHMQMREAKQ